MSIVSSVFVKGTRDPRPGPYKNYILEDPWLCCYVNASVTGVCQGLGRARSGRQRVVDGASCRGRCQLADR